MKKISLIVKEEGAKRIHERFSANRSFFVLKYSGIASPALSTLRQSLRGINAELFVVRNSVARRKLQELVGEDAAAFIAGPSGIVFYRDDPVATAKVIFDFVKGHEKLKVEGGFLQEKIIGSETVEALSRLPGKDQLRAQAIYTLKAPLTKLVMVLKGNLRGLVAVLEQIKNKKSA